MKIPETSANVGAYYGNEENGQWQPNGVIIDNGVGGGVVGSGDAGVHRPPVYPVHMPRGPVPAGYVMAGAYYPPAFPAAPHDDFADYMWMENEEEFDKQVMQQLEEEALMEQCIEAMLEDEQRERRAANSQNQPYPTTSNGSGSLSLEETISRSKLNPLAAEFVPTGVRVPPTTEDKSESRVTTETEQSRTTEQAEKQKDETKTDSQENISEEPPSLPKEPPEVSAADVQPIQTHRQKPKDIKKPIKTDIKKTKPQTVKSDTKVQPKKREVKSVKSEVTVEEKSEEAVEVTKTQPTPQAVEECPQPGVKPINYAAAAKASKPKQKSASPPLEPKPQTKEAKPIDKKPQTKEKVVAKEKVQRKNSVK